MGLPRDRQWSNMAVVTNMAVINIMALITNMAVLEVSRGVKIPRESCRQTGGRLCS